MMISNTVVVPILGMHRSGTSMITRAMNLMGLDLGKPLLGPHADNPRGFWENQFFLAANIKILQALGLDGDGFAPRSMLLEAVKRSSELKIPHAAVADIENYIEHEFSNQPWGWKDPRTLLLFPFWLRLLYQIGFTVIRPVIIMRQREPCIQSLLRRGDLSRLTKTFNTDALSLAEAIWATYNQIALEIHDRLDCHICHYESLINPERASTELRACANYIGLPSDRLLSAVDWINPLRSDTRRGEVFDHSS